LEEGRKEPRTFEVTVKRSRDGCGDLKDITGCLNGRTKDIPAASLQVSIGSCVGFLVLNIKNDTFEHFIITYTDLIYTGLDCILRACSFIQLLDGWSKVPVPDRLERPDWRPGCPPGLHHDCPLGRSQGLDNELERKLYVSWPVPVLANFQS
jgi:hypothetical protein